jgi:hypothetical protein
MVYRLYQVNKITGKCTGKKRDYPSEEHFKKYGKETYDRYDSMSNYRDKTITFKAKLCYLDENNKWKELTNEMFEELWKD